MASSCRFYLWFVLAFWWWSSYLIWEWMLHFCWNEQHWRVLVNLCHLLIQMKFDLYWNQFLKHWLNQFDETSEIVGDLPLASRSSIVFPWSFAISWISQTEFGTFVSYFWTPVYLFEMLFPSSGLRILDLLWSSLRGRSYSCCVMCTLLSLSSWTVAETGSSFLL